MKIGGLAGILFVVLVWVAVVWTPLRVSTSEPLPDGPAIDILAYIQATHAGGSEYFGELLVMAALLCLTVFGVTLSVKLRSSDGQSSIPSTLLVVATGLLAAIFWIAIITTVAGDLRLRAHELDATTAALLFSVAYASWVTSWFVMGGFLIAAGVGGLSSSAFSKGLSWLGMCIGVGLLIGGAAPLSPIAPIGLVFYLLFFIWVLGAASVLLLDEALNPVASSPSTDLATDPGPVGAR